MRPTIPLSMTVARPTMSSTGSRANGTHGWARSGTWTLTPGDLAGTVGAWGIPAGGERVKQHRKLPCQRRGA